MRRFALLGIVAAAALAGCGKQPVECSAASAAGPVISIVKREIEKQASSRVRSDGEYHVSRSKIRAAISQLKIALDDIRTSKEDPNSTKRFCEATLKITFPSDAIEEAERAREAAELNSVSELADNAEIDQEADRFSSSVEFNVQPTDDGEKVFAEMESGNNLFEFAAEVLASSLLRSVVEDQQRESAQAQASAAAEEEAAITEQRGANLNVAKTDNQLALQSIGALWKAIPSDVRARLLPAQRAWIRKKDADCRVEAASASTESSEREVARLNCDTRLNNERAAWLNQFRGQEDTTSLAPAEEGEVE
jgi:uncharacterized protein YecT (DUF1311 family)